LTREREQRFVFDEVAELYARARPGYPSELVEDVIGEAGLKPGARVLELGAGPGNASVLFAGRGLELVCLEPGPQLSAIAARRLAGDPQARVAQATFEHWVVELPVFDLVFAAQSFHWLDPAVRFSKAARVLRPNGTLAVFANRPLHGSAPVDLQIQDVYARRAMSLGERSDQANTSERLLEAFTHAVDFEPAQCREYAWHTDYSTARYLELLQTHSDHRLLGADGLRELLAGVGRAIDENGGHFRVEYVSVLCWAHRGR
jgi:SAM-dependent methyltransferase